MHGIDISNWQDGLSIYDIDIEFCICKATEGLGYTDPTCDVFIQECNDKGILWGFYHFARENEPEDEAEYFYSECRGYFNHGVPVLDYETENYDNAQWCERFLNRLHELSGVWAMLYISASRCGQYDGSWIPQRCGLWVAGYPWEMNSYDEAGDMPYDISSWDFAAIWQFTSSLYLSGYGSSLDGDIAYMSADAWMKYANATDEPQPTPTPTPAPPVDDLVRRTLAGEFGNGGERREKLGERYDEVQNRIDELYQIADEVIEGRWGNGWNREQALEGAGYPYDIVQGIVNSIYAERDDYNGC